MLEGMFLIVLNRSLMGGFIILVVLLMRLLLRSAPKIFSHVLWAVVMLRLLCPASLQGPWSLVPAVEPVTGTYVQATTPPMETVTGQNGQDNTIAETEEPAHSPMSTLCFPGRRQQVWFGWQVWRPCSCGWAFPGWG